MKAAGLTPKLVAFLLSLVVTASQAAAQGVDVTATLDLTDGWARPGAYVPVRLRVTNRTDETLQTVRVDSNGPVRVEVPWRLAPGATGEKVLPVFYVGGDLALAVEFLAGGEVRARGRADSVEVRPWGDDVALVAVEAGALLPLGPALDLLAGALGGKTPYHLTLGPGDLAMVVRCGLLDAVAIGRAEPPAGDLAIVRRTASGGLALEPSAFPRGAGAAIQPEAYRLFAARVWPARDRGRLWLWLGIFSLAVVVAGLFVPRRRAVRATLVLIALAAGTTAVIYLFGDVRQARSIEARIFYLRVGGEWRAAVERFVWLGSRGGLTSRYLLRPQDPLPVPVLASSGELFRPKGTLYLGRSPRFESRRSGVLLHILETSALPFVTAVESLARGDLNGLGERPDVIRALVVDGNQGIGLGGAAMRLEAWAAHWKQHDDPAVAYAGRSVAWWADLRREGPGPWMVAWFRDEVAGGKEPVERAPAMVVCEIARRGP